jgi:hypothetical protein
MEAEAASAAMTGPTPCTEALVETCRSAQFQGILLWPKSLQRDLRSTLPRDPKPCVYQKVATTAESAIYVHIQERLTTVEVENDRYKAEKRQDRERVLELEEQINLLKEQQDRKLKQGLRELKKQMNYALNQSIMQQPGREDE